MPELTLYIKTGCPFCHKVTDFLDENDITINTKNISENPDYRKGLVDIAGKTQVPCLVIDGKPMHESDDIIEWMKESLVS